MPYLDPDLTLDETQAAEQTIAGIADRIDGWQPAEGSPETAFGESVGMVLSAIATLVVDEERKDYAGFGLNILGIPRGAGEPARATSTWTFTAPGSYVIPDGSEVLFDLADGTPVAFATVGDFAATGGAAVGVPLVALEPGAAPNGLDGEGRDFESLPFVDTVVLDDPVSEGADAEELDAYLDRITDRARRLKAVPITVDDYAALALEHPSVARAMAVRLLDPADPPAPGDDPSTGGHITLFTHDAEGQANSTEVKDEVVALLYGENRPLAITVHAEDPTPNDLALAVSIRLERDADEDATVAAVEDALLSAYDPRTYSYDRAAPGLWRAPTTDEERTVRHYDVAHVADTVPGVAGVTAATVNGGTSVVMTGWAPLPNLVPPPVVTVVS
jgi:hypothetical protein